MGQQKTAGSALGMLSMPLTSTCRKNGLCLGRFATIERGYTDSNLLNLRCEGKGSLWPMTVGDSNAKTGLQLTCRKKAFNLGVFAT